MARRDIESFELLNTQSQLDRAADHAFAFYHGAIPLEVCRHTVEDSYERLAGQAVVRHHLVPLAERWSLDRLRQRGIARGDLAKTAREVVVVDQYNSARSQMAAALLTLYARGRVNVSSAGVAPGEAVLQSVVVAMDEVGVDLSGAFPKPITDDTLGAADTVVSFGPLPDHLTPAPRTRVVLWDTEVVGGRGLETVRRVRDDIDRRVLVLLAELLEADTEGGRAGRVAIA